MASSLKELNNILKASHRMYSSKDPNISLKLGNVKTLSNILLPYYSTGTRPIITRVDANEQTWNEIDQQQSSSLLCVYRS